MQHRGIKNLHNKSPDDLFFKLNLVCLWINLKKWDKESGYLGLALSSKSSVNLSTPAQSILIWKNVDNIYWVQKMKQYDLYFNHEHLIIQVPNFRKMCIEVNLYNMKVFINVLNTYKISLHSIIHLYLTFPLIQHVCVNHL